MRKGKDPEPDPYLSLTNPDGPKTCGSPALHSSIQRFRAENRHKIRCGNYLDKEKRFPDEFFYNLCLIIKHAVPGHPLIISEISNNARLASDINPDINPEMT
jgi:hypothetical protein